MKNIPLYALLILASCNGSAPREYTSTLLKGATVYTGTGDKLENASIRVEKGEISCVGDCPEQPGDRIVDISGKFITPGLVDAHVHFFQTGFFDSRPDAMDLREKFPTQEVYAYQARHPDRYYRAYIGSGVTAVYDVGGMPWSVLLQRYAEENPAAPHVAAAGTLLTPAPEERISIFNMPNEKVMVHLDNAETGREVVRYNSELGSTGIKIWGMSPNNPEFVSAMEEVRDETERHGNKLIIHATSLEQAKMALEMGAKLLVHSVEDTLVDDEFITLAQANNVYYNPTLIVGRGYYNAMQAVVGNDFDLQDPHKLLDDGTFSLLTTADENAELTDTSRLKGFLPQMDESQRKTEEIMAANLKRVYEAGIKIVVGTDAGNPGTLHGVSIFNEMEAMQSVGISPQDLIIMATRNGAEAMERGDDLGTIETGKQADLVIFGLDPGEDIRNMRSIESTMRFGMMWELDN